MARAIGNANKKKQTTPQKYLCPYCGEMKLKADFYTSSDPMIKTGLTVMCRECAKNLARYYDEKSDKCIIRSNVDNWFMYRKCRGKRGQQNTEQCTQGR